MQTKKCPKCQLVNWLSSAVCMRCGFSFTNNFAESFVDNSRIVQRNGITVNQNIDSEDSPENVKKNAWSKIKWGLIISVITTSITVGVFSIGGFEGDGYINKVKFFSLITLLPPAAVLAGIIELITGISIFKIIEKWEHLPHWLGWLIGIMVFFLVLFVIIFVAAVIIFNFF